MGSSTHTQKEDGFGSFWEFKGVRELSNKKGK